MKPIAIYPGSFDPITRGHLDVLERASRLFPEVIMAVIVNPNKPGFLPLEERCRLISESTAHLPNVRVDRFQGLLVDYARDQGAALVVKGLRGPGDCEAELQMARLNRMMNPMVETLLLASEPSLVHVSSSFVREISKLGGDVSALVPECVLKKLKSMGETR